MLINGMELTAGSALHNPTIENGPSWPATGNVGALFFNTTDITLGMFDGVLESHQPCTNSDAG